MSLIGGGAGDLGVLLNLRRVLAATHVVVLAVMLGGRAMRLGCALVVIGRFCVRLTGHLDLDWPGNVRSSTSDCDSVRSECICCFY